MRDACRCAAKILEPRHERRDREDEDIPGAGEEVFMRGSFLGVLAPAAGMLLSAGAFAQDGGSASGRVAEGGHALFGTVTLTLRGSVIPLDRESRSNMFVELTLAGDPSRARDREGCDHPRRACIDEEGRYSIEGLAAGAYDVHVGWRGAPVVRCPRLEDWRQQEHGQVDVGSHRVQEYVVNVDCHVPRPPPPIEVLGKTRWAR